MFKPFQPGRAWKIAITLYLGRASSIFVPMYLLLLALIPLAHSKLGTVWTLVMVGAIALATAFYVAIFYWCTRLQFVAFEMVVHREQFVRPMWEKHRAAARRWFLAKVAWGTAICAVICLPAFRVLPRFAASVSVNNGHGQAPFALSDFIVIWSTMFFGIMFLFAVGFFLSELMVPPMALENLTVSEAWHRVVAMVGVDPWSFVRYALLKVAVSLVGYYAAIFAVEIVMLVAMLILGMVGLFLGGMIHLLGVPWLLLQTIGAVLAIFLWIGMIAVVLPMGLGMFMAFLDAYAMYFLAGRYAPLGAVLSAQVRPPTPSPFMPPEAF